MPPKQTTQNKSQKKSAATQEEDTGLDNSIMIIVIAVGVLAILVLAYCSRMLYVHMNIEKFKLEALRAQAEKAKAKVNKEIEIEVLEDQYNAANDFAVFGVGDARGGGMQTLQQKMNLADGTVEKHSSSDEEGEDDKPESGSDEETVQVAQSIEGLIAQMHTQ